jgi:DNA-binding LacI/PurR family transcriptional regulator
MVSTGLWAKLRTSQFSGVIAVGLDECLSQELQSFGIPMVSFGCPSPHIVGIDQVAVCEMGVSELARIGCRRICVYNAPYATLAEVLDGLILKGMNHRDLLIPTMAFRPGTPEFGGQVSMVEYGMREAIRLFGPKTHPVDRPDGVMCIDDTFTQGFLIGLSQSGFRPGAGVEIASYANAGSPALAPWNEDLIRLEISVRAVGRALVAGLEMVVGGQVPDRYGWEASTLLATAEGPVRNLMLIPELKRKSQL